MLSRETDIAAREDVIHREQGKAQRELQEMDNAAQEAIQKLEQAASDERVLQERLVHLQSEVRAK